MSNADALKDAQLLIATVMRAFYTDTHIVVVDLLLRESYVLAEQIGPRLRLRMRDLEKVLRELETHKIIKFEDVKNDQTGDTFRYYYIDYQICVAAIFYRIYRMKERLNEAERQQIKDIYYLCPSCNNHYSVLQVQAMLSKDFQFICSSCCPEDDYRDCDTRDYPEARFLLQEIDNTNIEASLQRTKKNLESQLWAIPGQHDGIMNLLTSNTLRSTPLPRNLPSENIKHGRRTSTVNDEEVIREMKEQMDNMAAGRTVGKSYINNRKRAATTQYIRDEHGQVVGMQVATADERRQMMEDNLLTDGSSSSSNRPGGAVSGGYCAPSAADFLQQQKREEITKQMMSNRSIEIPEHLRQSGVIGAEESIRLASSLQMERQLNAQRLVQQQQTLSSALPLSAIGVSIGHEVERIQFGEDETETAAKRPRVEPTPAQQPVREESSGANLEDIAWED